MHTAKQTREDRLCHSGKTSSASFEVMTLDSIKAVANPSTDCCGGIIPALQVQLSNQTPQAQLNLLGVGKEEVYFGEVLRCSGILIF
jgi:hypothetical protein